MTKYLLIDTFNGNGYSDSNAKIVETSFPNIYAKNLAERCMGGVEVFKVEAERGIHRWEYTIGDDSGAIVIMPVPKDWVGVKLMPNINDFEIVTDVKVWTKYINTVIENSEEFKEDGYITGTIHHAMPDDYDWILFNKGSLLINVGLKQEKDYDCTGDGDGVEYESWEHKITKELIRVPIEVVRDWDNTEPVK